MIEFMIEIARKIDGVVISKEKKIGMLMTKTNEIPARGFTCLFFTSV